MTPDTLAAVERRLDGLISVAQDLAEDTIDPAHAASLIARAVGAIRAELEDVADERTRR